MLVSLDENILQIFTFLIRHTSEFTVTTWLRDTPVRKYLGVTQSVKLSSALHLLLHSCCASCAVVNHLLSGINPSLSVVLYQLRSQLWQNYSVSHHIRWNSDQVTLNLVFSFYQIEEYSTTNLCVVSSFTVRGKKTLPVSRPPSQHRCKLWARGVEWIWLFKFWEINRQLQNNMNMKLTFNIFCHSDSVEVRMSWTAGQCVVHQQM